MSCFAWSRTARFAQKNAPFQIRQRSGVLQIGRNRQDKISRPCRLRHEHVGYDEKFKTLDCRLDEIGVRIGNDRVGAHDEQRFNFSVVHLFHHFVCRYAFAGQLAWINSPDSGNVPAVLFVLD
ncbi:hypothetical protein D3C84_957090 [compost metagenome]